MGGYGHPDHIYTYKTVEKALEISTDPTVELEGLEPFMPERVYLHTFPRKFMRLVVKLMPLFGKIPPSLARMGIINFVEIMRVDFPIHLRVRYIQICRTAGKSVCLLQEPGWGIIKADTS
jgi:N-acetyl-1-D-myo-inositol-2-amino-2-deoxy-alpha-D-glucopyranoside deacetylase/mycothiol S-conjugate amidase